VRSRACRAPAADGSSLASQRLDAAALDALLARAGQALQCDAARVHHAGLQRAMLAVDAVRRRLACALSARRPLR
jgi:hypothetical protein